MFQCPVPEIKICIIMLHLHQTGILTRLNLNVVKCTILYLYLSIRLCRYIKPAHVIMVEIYKDFITYYDYLSVILFIVIKLQ